MIDGLQRLAEFLPRLAAAEWITLDTEADSLHSYPEKLCLVQISIPGADVLIDPLAGLDLSPLVRLLGSRELVLHGADYDLRLLRRRYDFVPHAVFDTMLAARLLGQTSFGLTNLVEKYLGLHLEKGPQKADWSRRPLTERMLIYARNDTRHLQPLAVRLREELRAKQRLEWHREACQQLIEESTQVRPRDPDQIWRLAGSDKLSRHALAVLRSIWHWREQEAIRVNRPLYFILSHEALVAIAAAVCEGKPYEPLLPRRFSDLRRAELQAAITHGFTLPVTHHPALFRPRHHRGTAADKRRFEELRRRRDQAAVQLELDPALIASRATLVLLSQDWATNQRQLMRWQCKLLS